jgi:hypothetical protein
MRPSMRDMLSDWVRACLLQSIRGGWADRQVPMVDVARKLVGQLLSHLVVERLQQQNL